VKSNINSKNLPLVAGSSDGGKMFGEIEEENFQAPLGECEILKIGLHDKSP
jgi:hypothetical protein